MIRSPGFGDRRSFAEMDKKIVPWEALKPYLTPEGVRIFGGARPKGDDEGQ